MRGIYRRNFKRQIYMVVGILLLLILVFIGLISMYNNRLKRIAESMLSQEMTIGLLTEDKKEENKEEAQVLEEASLKLSKSIEEVTNEINEKINLEEVNFAEEKREETEETISGNVDNQEIKDIKKNLDFSMPVEGDIIGEFAIDKLIFSETLQEWITHNGIDIKSERTTVVKAAEDGTIEDIKEDPRYGLTVIISHIDGYETVYANLLTSEFIKKGDSVKKGDSIGTVGNSAVFEIAEEPHLHFELLLNGEYLDPKLYLK